MIIDNVLPLLSDDNQTLAYAVNFKGGGYNIVSATQKYSPIIGFSEKGSIQQDYREENPGLAFWLDFLKGDIVYQINKNDDSDSIAIMNRMLWREYEAVALSEKNNFSYDINQRSLVLVQQEETGSYGWFIYKLTKTDV